MIPFPSPDEHPAYAAKYVALAKADMDTLGLEVLEELLVRQPGDLGTLLSHVPLERGMHAYAPGKWTLLESLVHVNDSERVFSYRMLRAARGDRTPIPGYDHDAWVPHSGAATRTLLGVIAEFGAIRAATMALVANLDQEALARTTVASETNVSARALAWMIAGHTAHHLRLTRDRYLIGLSSEG